MPLQQVDELANESEGEQAKCFHVFLRGLPLEGLAQIEAGSFLP